MRMVLRGPVFIGVLCVADARHVVLRAFDAALVTLLDANFQQLLPRPRVVLAEAESRPVARRLQLWKE